ncbi:MAG: hypothetical protein IPF55_16240 [Rhodoferax sp.]|nr:hypothetical protein [Rhodoferax sp.]
MTHIPECSAAHGQPKNQERGFFAAAGLAVALPFVFLDSKSQAALAIVLLTLNLVVVGTTARDLFSTYRAVCVRLPASF